MLLVRFESIVCEMCIRIEHTHRTQLAHLLTTSLLAQNLLPMTLKVRLQSMRLHLYAASNLPLRH
jgi:hypothetical protein